MVIYRCDRCKKEVPLFNYNDVTIKDSGTNHLNEEYGLCESCIKDLKIWIEHKSTIK